MEQQRPWRGIHQSSSLKQSNTGVTGIVLSYVDVQLAALELAAVQIGDTVAKIPDLVELEEWLVEAGLV